MERLRNENYFVQYSERGPILLPVERNIRQSPIRRHINSPVELRNQRQYSQIGRIGRARDTISNILLESFNTRAPPINPTLTNERIREIKTPLIWNDISNNTNQLL